MTAHADANAVSRTTATPITGRCSTASPRSWLLELDVGVRGPKRLEARPLAKAAVDVPGVDPLDPDYLLRGTGRSDDDHCHPCCTTSKSRHSSLPAKPSVVMFVF